VITRDGRLVHKNPPNMNPADNLKLTKRNAVAIAQYATVVGAYTGEILERSSWNSFLIGACER
jgi:hypothetical protein